MKKTSIAILLCAGAVTGAVHAQQRPANTVVQTTDPAAIEQVEQHAREAQASAERAQAMQRPSPARHGRHHRHAPHGAAPQ